MTPDEAIAHFVVLYVEPRDRDRAQRTLADLCASEYARGAHETLVLVDAQLDNFAQRLAAIAPPAPVAVPDGETR